ncbi:Cenp-O kinetochore centromere component-domain-containing protein [Syncephalastrum racemosum]|uniref:Cenp-O kinetochore centromere component-domain-containing protein n=1 Tax=Syncephalastrum racemosum TaxID=13706 RepID=A0A1X2H6F3_SYNRA|nr:Cenp-O kinetochore centromere component-domain-containing protein [Syncephalastrum racemosum]
MSDEDALLPTPSDKLKSEISQLRQRLIRAEEHEKRLLQELMEEDIKLYSAQKFSDSIRDTTREKASTMTDLREKILERMMTTLTNRCVQEVVGYYRLTGRTIFTFRSAYTGVRFDTFYDRRYFEPYYILFRGNEEHPDRTLYRHTIPHFIPIKRLQHEFLPQGLETLCRILHDFLLAYVSRREQVQDLVQLKESRPSLHIASNDLPVTKVQLMEDRGSQPRVHVSLIYDNMAAELPTRVSITHDHQERAYPEKEQVFRDFRLPEAYRIVFGVN